MNPLAHLKPIRVLDDQRVRFLGQYDDDPKEEKRLREALLLRDERKKAERARYNAWCVERGREPLEDLAQHRFADYLHPLVMMALHTGMRRGELFQLTWENISLANKNVTVSAKTAKGQRTRHIPLNAEILQILKDWKQQGSARGLVFPNLSTGSRLTTVKRSFAKLLEDAKITGFNFHDLRHHFASVLVQAGVPLFTVKELLGHSSLDMTQRYAHLAPEQKHDAVSNLAWRY